MNSQSKIFKLVEKSQNWSNESWVNLTENFKGIQIKNMSLYHLMLLDGLESPFLKKKTTANDIDICLFLWVVSADYCENAKKQKQFFKKVVKITNIEAINFIHEYLDKTFSESETMNLGDKGQTYFLSYFVDLFAREYSWDLDKILNLPLRIAFQLVTAINERNAKKAGEKYTRTTELDNRINRWMLKGNSQDGI